MQTITIIGSRSLSKMEAKKLIRAQLPKGANCLLTGGHSIGEAAKALSKELGLKYREMLPDYTSHTHYMQAINARNEAIIAEADQILAIWDGKSGGTAREIKLAQKLGKPLKLINLGASTEQKTLF